MKQEKRISYKAGITRTPSDFLCADGELAECINLTTDNEELKPMVQPAEKMRDVPDTLIFIHNYNNEVRYIVRDEDTIKWGTNQNGTYTPGRIYVPEQHIGDIVIPAHYDDAELFSTSGSLKVTAIGKILVFSTDGSLKYCIWKPDGYKSYDSIPVPEVEFAMSKQSSSGDVSLFTDDTTIDWETCVEDSGNATDIINIGPDSASINDQEKYNDLILSLYSKQKKHISEKKAFCLPFFVRTALEFNDGSYMYISNPILLFPSVTRNALFDISANNRIIFKTTLSYLYYRSLYDYSEWNDIIKGVTVFVSAPIEINDIWSDLPEPIKIQTTETNFDRIVGNYYQSVFEIDQEPSGGEFSFYAFSKRDELDLNKDIESTSIFYRLASIGLTGTGMSGEHSGWQPMAGKIGKYILENLINQEQLKKDDFYSRCSLHADMMYAYNSRLNLAGIRRGFFEGFGFFLPFDNVSEAEYTALVRIKTDSGNRIVKKVWTTSQKQGIWFYYPDPRAEYVTIWKVINGATYCVLDSKLTEHPGLNGAYCFKGVPDSTYQESVTASADAIPIDTVASVDPELLPNKLVQSEVSNPFVFNSGGYHDVGTGTILAMSTTTQALSQAQFGPFPLLVFADRGIWSMSVDKTGLYESIYPISREVCINPGNIIQTDGAVFFVSKKGLMVAAGEGNYKNIAVRCVSERMNGAAFDTSILAGLGAGIGASGAPTLPWAMVITDCQDGKSFLDYIRDEACMMAYDYIDSRLLIINARTETVSEEVEGQTITHEERVFHYCYVYNMADGTISKAVLPADMDNTVNDYPDYLLQSGGTLYTLYGKPREEEVKQRQTAFLVTRPMKLAGPLAVASLRELVNVGVWDDSIPSGAQSPDSMVKTDVWVSDNLRDWYRMGSRFGAAAKYCRIGLYIKMLPTERLSGTIIREEPRRTDNLRA